jgi:Ca2+/H+ antiporter
VPAVFHKLARGRTASELQLDTEIAVVLLATYCISLVFTLFTHRGLYATSAVESDGHDSSSGDVWRWVVMLLAARPV